MKVDYFMDFKNINCVFIKELILNIINSDDFVSGNDFYHKYIRPNGSIEDFIKDTDFAIDDYCINDDHGRIHSIKVYERCIEILTSASENDNCRINCNETRNVLKWSAVFHDLSRFYGADSNNHEIISKEIVKNIFFDVNDYVKSEILLCIERHDWFNLEMSGGLEDKFKRNPIVDLFRLADKTSLPPVEEIERYYKTGRRYKTQFFNPNLSIERRFDLKNNFEDRDAVTYFLFLFKLNCDSFFFNTTRRLYKKWATEKENAKNYIINHLCVLEEIPKNQIEMIEQILKMV